MENRQTPLLDVQDLSISFRNAGGDWVRVVDGMTYSLPASSSLGIVGESGSGKSVSAMAILRLLPSRVTRVEGSIRFAGADVLGLGHGELSMLRGGEIGIVFQDPMSALDPVFTVGSQIAESYRRHNNASRRAAKSRAAEMLALVDIPDPHLRCNEYPHEMSGGMRQRAMIVMALVNDPKLLIADEPTTALDVTIQAQILKLIETVRAEIGLSLLLISHDIDVVASMCERVLTMYAGQAVEGGSASEVFEHPAHPYTRALMLSAPKAGLAHKTPLAEIEGNPPTPEAFPVGCRFRPRCPLAAEPCLEPQGMVVVGEDRAARCWRAVELVADGVVR